MARQAVQGAHTGAPVGPTVEFKVHFRNGDRGRKRLRRGVTPTPKPAELGRIPRVAKLMALAIRFEKLIHQGVVRDYADLARLGGVSRARVSQIMDLLNLAPGIQEEILFLPRTTAGRDPIGERDLRPISAVAAWSAQRRLWRELPNSQVPE